jgi:hypothetical protein
VSFFILILLWLSIYFCDAFEDNFCGELYSLTTIETELAGLDNFQLLELGLDHLDIYQLILGHNYFLESVNFSERKLKILAHFFIELWWGRWASLFNETLFLFLYRLHWGTWFLNKFNFASEPFFVVCRFNDLLLITDSNSKLKVECKLTSFV